MGNKYEFFENEMRQINEKGLLTLFRTVESAQGAWIVIAGKRVLNLCSNNYLGLANHPELKKAVLECLERFGAGPGAVRTIAGTTELHVDLEKTLAEFKGVEDVITYQSGYAANLGAISALIDDGDAVFSDELNHASIIDGIKLTKAKRFVYPHADADALAKIMEKEAAGYNKKLIITDGVFSMDGDLGPLPELADVAEAHDALLMVDDAHGEGVLGSHGRGIVDHFNVHGRVDIEMGTMSKALGVVGGYIAGKQVIVDYLRQRSRAFKFTTGSTPMDAAACMAAVKLLESSDELVKRLWENTDYFKNEMKSLGIDTGKTETPITPVMLGDEKLASEFSKRMLGEDIYVQAIKYPTVPMGTARLRVMISAAHSREDLDFAVAAIKKVGKELGVIQ